MRKGYKANKFRIPDTRKVEVISIKGDRVFKKEMAYHEALALKKKKGWSYKIYQLGFSQFNQKNQESKN